MARVGAKDPLEMSPARMSVQSKHSVRTVLTQRSAKAFARGARIGVLMTWPPSVRNTSSKGPECAYLEHVVLKQRPHNPYVVGEVMVDPTSAESFTNALHGSYSGLNKTLELPFARELDAVGVKWCRNPSRSGFGLPLLSPGQSKTFYPDFLAWTSKNVFALDTKGEHIL
jgi:hypothetical protein